MKIAHRYHRRTRVTNHRGAALLLSVYFVALALLTLSGALFHRTVTDLRVAENHRDRQQAFYFAEAGIDKVLADLHTGRAQFEPDGSETFLPSCGVFSTGQTDCRIRAFPNLLLPMRGGGVLSQNFHQITPTATQQRTTSSPARTTAEVTALLQTVDLFTGGIVTRGKVTVNYRDWELDSEGWYRDDQPIDIYGHIQTNLGEWETVRLTPGVTLNGNITIAPSCGDECDGGSGYTRLVGNDTGEWDGVILEDGWGEFPAAKVTGTINAEPMPPMPKTAPALPAECQSQRLPWLWVDEQEKRRFNYEWDEWEDIDVPADYHIRDGFVDSENPKVRDLTPAGDGRVVMCVQDVTVEQYAKITVHDPTVIFTASGWSVDNRGEINTAASLKRQSDRGLTIVDTTESGGYAELGDFEGSVYAPFSDVVLGPSEKEAWGQDVEHFVRDGAGGYYDTTTKYYRPTARKMGFIVANTLEINGTDLDFGVRGNVGHGFQAHGESQESPRTTYTQVAMWSASQAPVIIEQPSVTDVAERSSAFNSELNDAGSEQDNSAVPPPTGTGSGGNGTDESSGSDSGGGGKVICTELHRQGYIPDAWIQADFAYAAAYVDAATIKGYHFWATPLVRLMRRSWLITQLIRPFGSAWAHHMAFVMGAADQDSWLGRLMNQLGIPINRAFGQYLMEREHRLARLSAAPASSAQQQGPSALRPALAAPSVR